MGCVHQLGQLHEHQLLSDVQDVGQGEQKIGKTERKVGHSAAKVSLGAAAEQLCI
jgi:hypothetical protein